MQGSFQRPACILAVKEMGVKDYEYDKLVEQEKVLSTCEGGVEAATTLIHM